ncbi:MAG: twin-arginine translocase TatA/TatE family subunit [Candidatus Omnitrophica bacterium]|nr:twin-arginine translocase TatA/TatE family subunit [Candidatus Omnitrophota bacterium]
MQELLLVFVVALLIFGPRKLPHIGRMMGKAMRELKKYADEFKHSLEDESAVEGHEHIQEYLNDVEENEKKSGKHLGG